MTATPAKKSNRVLWIVIGLVGLLVVVPACIGILAAVAIPSFIGYMRRAKTSEAATNLHSIARSMEAYRVEFGTYPTSDLPPTPSEEPGPMKHLWPSDPDPGWTQLGFSPMEPLYYQYEVDTSPDGLTYVARARGDLDGDGLQSRFELSSSSADIVAVDETE